jgi:hypothetical protein
MKETQGEEIPQKMANAEEYENMKHAFAYF